MAAAVDRISSTPPLPTSWSWHWVAVEAGDSFCTPAAPRRQSPGLGESLPEAVS